MLSAHQIFWANGDPRLMRTSRYYRLDGGVPVTSVGVNFYFLIHHDVQAGTDTHSAPHLFESGNFILRVKRSELEAENRPVELRVESWITLSLPFYTFCTRILTK
jgi:hypothetical protein